MSVHLRRGPASWPGVMFATRRSAARSARIWYRSSAADRATCSRDLASANLRFRADLRKLRTSDNDVCLTGVSVRGRFSAVILSPTPPVRPARPHIRRVSRGDSRLNTSATESGLYDRTLDKSSCGVGFITRKDGIQTHDVLIRGHEALCAVPHRGGMSAEGVGDGAGVCVDLSVPFFRTLTGQDRPRRRPLRRRQLLPAHRRGVPRRRRGRHRAGSRRSGFRRAARARRARRRHRAPARRDPAPAADPAVGVHRARRVRRRDRVRPPHPRRPARDRGRRVHPPRSRRAVPAVAQRPHPGAQGPPQLRTR